MNLLAVFETHTCISYLVMLDHHFYSPCVSSNSKQRCERPRLCHIHQMRDHLNHSSRSSMMLYMFFSFIHQPVMSSISNIMRVLNAHLKTVCSQLMNNLEPTISRATFIFWTQSMGNFYVNSRFDETIHDDMYSGIRSSFLETLTGEVGLFGYIFFIL